MKTALKILGISAAVLVSAAAALLIWLSTLDPNEHKGWIASQFEARTGRPLTLAGPLHFSLYPWLGLSAADVSIAEANGGQGEFFQADLVELRVKLLPLLTGRYEIDTVRLHGAQLNLRVDEAGNDNWSDLAGSPVEESTPREEEGGLSLANVVLGGVDVRELGLSYDDRQQDLHYELADLNFSTGPLAFGEAIPLQSTFTLSASSPELSAALALEGSLAYDAGGTRYELAPLRLSGSVSGPGVPDGEAPVELNTRALLDLEEDSLAIPELALRALGMQAQASVEGQSIQSEAARFQAAVAVSGSDLAVFLRMLENPELAERVDSLASQEYSLNARLAFDGGAGSLQVEGLQAQLLGAAISGEMLAAGLGSEALSLQGNVDAGGPDLPALVEVAGQLGGGPDLSEFGRQLAQVPDRDFALNSAFSADLGAGVLSVPALDLRLLGASIQGSLDASGVDSDSPRVQGAVNANGPDLPLLLQVAGHWLGGREAPLNQFGLRLRRNLSERSFSVSSDFDADLRAGDIQVPTLEARLPGFTLSGRVNGSGLAGNNGSLDGNLRLQGEGLSPWLAAVQQPGLAEVAQSVDLTLEMSGGRRDLRIIPRASLVVAGPRIPQSPATIALATQANLDLEADRLTLADLSLAGMGLNLSGNASVEALSEEPSASGSLALQPVDLRALLTQLQLPLPAMADPETLRQVAFSGDFQASADLLALENLQAQVDESRLSGSGSLATPANAVIAFNLQLDRLDADRYLPPPVEGETEEASEASDGELPVESLRALQLDGRLDVNELTLAGLRMNQISLRAEAGDGRLVLTPALQLYEGSYGGELALDASGELPVLAVQSSLSDIALGPLLQDALQANYLSGKGDLSLSLSSSGASMDALLGSLRGEGRVDLSEGVLQGVDVAGVLAQIEAIIRTRRLVTVQRGNQTAFETFGATLNVNEGVVSSNDLLLDAQGFTVSGAGVLANLREGTLDFDLLADVEETPTDLGGEQYDIGGYSLPIACTGSLSEPRCLPDTQSILSAALSNAVERGLGDLLNRALGGDEGQRGGQAAPQTAPAPDGQTPQQAQPPAEEEPVDPRQELLNRALEGLLR